jgi:predicted MFS family arabinose efflux permease
VAVAPALAAATVALNTSAVYLGQSIGAAAGGFVIADGITVAIAWTAIVFLALALAMSIVTSRLARRNGM